MRNFLIALKALAWMTSKEIGRIYIAENEIKVFLMTLSLHKKFIGRNPEVCVEFSKSFVFSSSVGSIFPLFKYTG